MHIKQKLRPKKTLNDKTPKTVCFLLPEKKESIQQTHEHLEPDIKDHFTFYSCQSGQFVHL